MVRPVKDRFTPDDKATVEWLDSQKRSTRATYKVNWNLFLEFTGMTGDEILESRKDDKNFTWEKKTLEFKRWLIEEKKRAQKTATTSAATVRGFFAYHRMDLKFRRTESVRLSEAKAKYEDYRFSKEDLAKVAKVGDLTEQYVVVAGKSFGLRAGDFLRLTRGDLEAYIDRDPPIAIGEYSTQKESVKAFPFIDTDAKPLIKLMLQQMNREGRTDPNERMLTYTDTIQLSRIVRRVAERAGINIGNKRVRFHCLRKFLCDRLSSYMSESKWKQIVGKSIEEGAYVSPDSLRADYQRAMGETTFSKAVGEEDVQLLAKKEALKMMAKLQGVSEEEMKRIFRIKQATTLQAEVKALEEITEKRANPKTATNGGRADCQQLISEEELPRLLAEGWRVQAVLSSGKIVVER